MQKLLLFGLALSWIPGLPGQSHFRPILDSLLVNFRTLETEKGRAETADKLSEFYFLNLDYDSSRYYAEYELSVGRRIGSDSLLADAFRALSILERQTGTISQAITYGDSAIVHYFNSGDELGASVVLNNTAFLQSQTGNCPQAIAYAERADSLRRLLGVSIAAKYRSRLTYLTVLGDCNMLGLIPDLAYEYIPTIDSVGDYDYLASYYMRLMNTYRETGAHDSARVYSQKIQRLLPKVRSRTIPTAYTSNAARLYRAMGQYERAYELLIQGLAYANSINSAYSIANKRINLGHVCYLMERYRESIEHYREGLPYFVNNQQKNSELADHFQYLADAYVQVGDYRNGIENMKVAAQITDSLRLVEHQDKVEEITLKFETERVKRELVETSLALREKEAAIERNRRLMGGFGGGSILLMAVAGGFIRARRRRKQLEYDKKQAELRYNLLRAQMNPHFIFNSLNSIQSFFSNQRFGQGNEFLGTFSQLVRRVLEQTGQKAITLAEEIETLDLYLQLEKLRLGNVLNYEIHLGPGLDPEITRVPPLIFQPFVENAIWHGIAPKNGPGKIDIYLEYDETRDAIAARIEDDGLGMNNGAPEKNQNHRSRGVEITRERLGGGGRIDIRDRSVEDPGCTGVSTELVIPLWE